MNFTQHFRSRSKNHNRVKTSCL